MKNKDKSKQSNTNHKNKLFNSDGFDLFISILTASVKFILFIFGILLKIISVLLTPSSKSKTDNGHYNNFVSTDITDIDAEINEKGYYK